MISYPWCSGIHQAVYTTAVDSAHSATRSTTGCGAPKNRQTAIDVLQKLVARENPLNVSRSMRGRGYALMAHLHYMQHKPNTPNIDALFEAARWMNDAASIGFVPQLLLTLAGEIHDAGFGIYDHDCAEHSSTSRDRFGQWEDMWKASFAASRESSRKTRRREMHVQENRNLYFCAASGCGIEATHRACLSRCNGKCPANGKPSYCSKECQRKVRPFHQSTVYDLITLIHICE